MEKMHTVLEFSSFSRNVNYIFSFLVTTAISGYRPAETVSWTIIALRAQCIEILFAMEKSSSFLPEMKKKSMHASISEIRKFVWLIFLFQCIETSKSFHTEKSGSLAQPPPFFGPSSVFLCSG